MANGESEGRTEKEKVVDEMNAFLGEAVIDCWASLGKYQEKSMGEWGVSFYSGMLQRIDAVKQAMGGAFDLEAFRRSAIERAETLDVNSPVFRIDTQGRESTVSVAKEIHNSWSGLTAELAVLDLLRSLSIDGDLVLYEPSDDLGGTALLEEFDRLGRADFLAYQAENGVWVGVQVKRFQGDGLAVIDGGSEEAIATVKAELEELKKTRPAQRQIYMTGRQNDFAEVVEKYFDKDKEHARLIFVLVGVGTVDTRTGSFRDNRVAWGGIELIKRTVGGELSYGVVNNQAELKEVVK